MQSTTFIRRSFRVALRRYLKPARKKGRKKPGAKPGHQGSSQTAAGKYYKSCHVRSNVLSRLQRQVEQASQHDLQALRDGLGIFALQVGEQPAHKHEGVLASFASRQQYPKRSEKGLQPLVHTGKATFRNFCILLNFTLSCRKSRVHDNHLPPNTRVYSQNGKIDKINFLIEFQRHK